MRKKFKNFIIILFLLFTFFIITAYSYANTISNDLSNIFFRLHIIANSDSEEDQDLKLKVRDKVIEYVKQISNTSTSKEETIEIISNNLENIEEIAKNVINENGYDYNINLKIGNFYFPTKYYGNISLPAGNYDGLKIEIGDSQGQNWWCSLFPPLCFINISSGVIDENGEEYLKENLSDEEYSLISSQNTGIDFKFKIIEIIKNRI